LTAPDKINIDFLPISPISGHYPAQKLTGAAQVFAYPGFQLSLKKRNFAP